MDERENILKRMCIRYETLGTRMIQVILGLFVILRLKMAIKTASFIDTRFYIETADFIRRGISPYHSEDFLSRFPGPPMQPPSMSLLSMPLCFFSKSVQNALFFYGGIIAFCCFVVMIFQYNVFQWK